MFIKTYTTGFNAGRAFYIPSDKAVWYRSHEQSDRRHELFHWATLSNQSEDALPLIAVEGVAVWGNWKLMTDAQRRENLNNFHNYEKTAYQIAKSRLAHNLTLDSQDMTPIELMVYGSVLFQCLEEKLGPIKTAESFFQLQHGQSLNDWVSKLGLDPLELEKTWRDKIYTG